MEVRGQLADCSFLSTRWGLEKEFNRPVWRQRAFPAESSHWPTVFILKPQKTTIPRFLSEAAVRPETEFCEGRSADITTSPNRNTMSISLSKSPVSVITCLSTLSNGLHTQQPQLLQHNVVGWWLQRQKLLSAGCPVRACIDISQLCPGTQRFSSGLQEWWLFSLHPLFPSSLY